MPGSNINALKWHCADNVYKGFAVSEGFAYMKATTGSQPLTKEDLTSLPENSSVIFYTCTGPYLQATRTTTTTPSVVIGGNVDVINSRFMNSNIGDLTQAGVIIHQWDNMEGTGTEAMWTPCQAEWCVRLSDRFSTSIINFRSPKQGKKIGLFSDTLGGFIVSPTEAQVSCSYPDDGGTMAKTCSEDGSPAPGCTPGCSQTQCDATTWWGCSYPPYALGDMFQKYKEMNSKYNEVVIGTANWKPSSIEAFFYVASPGKCSRELCDKNCIKSRDVYKAFLQTVHVQVHFLCLDIGDWSSPFKDMST
jgi:hypothetical protein